MQKTSETVKIRKKVGLLIIININIKNNTGKDNVNPNFNFFNIISKEISSNIIVL